MHGGAPPPRNGGLGDDGGGGDGGNGGGDGGGHATPPTPASTRSDARGGAVDAVDGEARCLRQLARHAVARRRVQARLGRWPAHERRPQRAAGALQHDERRSSVTAGRISWVRCWQREASTLRCSSKDRDARHSRGAATGSAPWDQPCGST